MTQLLPEGIHISPEHQGRFQFNVRLPVSHPAVLALEGNMDRNYINPLVPVGLPGAHLVYRGRFGGRRGGWAFLNFMQSHLEDVPSERPEFEIE